MDKLNGMFMVLFLSVISCSYAEAEQKIIWPPNVPDSVKKTTVEDPRFNEKMDAIEKLRRKRASEISMPWESQIKKADSYLKNLQADGSFIDQSWEKVLEDLKARKFQSAEKICTDAMVEHVSIRLSTLLKLWAIGPYKKDPALKEKLYRSLVYYMDIENTRKDYRWCGSAMLAPAACCDAYFCFFDDMEGVEKGELKEPLIVRANELVRKVACHSFTKPKRSDVENPLSIEQFRGNANWVGGNFGYRPLLDTALVCRNPKMLDVVTEVCRGALSVTSWNTRKTSFWQEGMTADGIGWGHGTQGYVWGYPLDGMNGVFKQLNFLKGTLWADKIELECIRTAINYVQGCLWYLYLPDGFTLMAPGRISMKYGKFCGKGGLQGLAQKILNFLPENAVEERKELQHYIDIMEGNAKEISGNRYFWNNDDMIQRRDDYYVGVNMTSARSSSTEVVNSSTSHTEYICDGSTFLMKRPDVFNAAKGFWKLSAIPGTTTRQTVLNADYSNHLGFTGVNNFAGGVSDGKLGACAFIYEKAFSNVAKNPSLFAVSAKKSYFMFENEMLCLGSGIINKNPELDGEIRTCVNQAEERGDINWSVDGGKTVSEMRCPSREQISKITSPIMLAHDGLGYIILPEQTCASIDISLEERPAKWMEIYPNANKNIPDKPEKMKMLQIDFNHGKNPDKDTYAYIVNLRCKDFEALRQYYDSKPLTVLSNTETLQAVKHNHENITQAVFYNPEAILISGKTTLSVNAPAVIMVKENVEGEMTVIVADPCQNPDLKELQIKINKHLSGPGVTDREDGVLITMPLPENPYCGKAVLQNFHIRDKVSK